MVLRHSKYFLELMKPTIMLMSVFSSLVGMVLANTQISLTNLLLSNLGIAITVGSACAFNMYFERFSDAMMERTKNRPIASGRLNANVALVYCILIGVLGIFIMFYQNTFLGILGLLSLFLYVGPYTLFKRKSYFSVLVGMIPGAAPVLMGWVAATGRFDWPGVWLFLLIILWQIPHTLIIAHYLKDDYKKAGIKTLTAWLGRKNAKILGIISSFFLLIYTLIIPSSFQVNSYYYFVAIILGLLYLYFNIKGYFSNANHIHDKKIKSLSLIHLSCIFLALVF
jgi:protoheme IX farnesyltransferase